MAKFVYGLCAAIIIACQSSFVVAEDGGDADRRPEKQSFLNSYVPKMANKLDFYYTVEDDTSPSSDLWYLDVAGDEGVKDIDGFIKQLQAQLPRSVVIVHSDDSRAVVHFMTDKLRATKRYELDRRVTLSLAGTPDDLIKAVHGKGLNVWSTGDPSLGVGGCGAVSLGSQIHDDRTLIAVSAKNQTVRDILTDWLPLSDYHRCLWKVSASADDTAGPFLSVEFQGPVSTPGEHPGIAEPFSAGPFSGGEGAYRMNPDTPEYVDQAIEFIDQHLSKKEPLQVRWAMLYLGKYKVEKGIPVLLKYLDYQYTNCHNVEDAYPASKALEGIGQPAATAILAAMGMEKDATRLMLMCRVVRIAMGDEDGPPAIERVARNAGGEQADRIRAAVKVVASDFAPLPTLPTTKPTTEPARVWTPLGRF